jgi:hypothetical protein
MTTLYKLTNEYNGTYNNTIWGKNVTNSVNPFYLQNNGARMCSAYWIHAYTHPLLAAIFNPMHANFERPKLWMAKGTVGATEKGLKVGVKSLTTIKQIPLPRVTNKQMQRFALLVGIMYWTEADNPDKSPTFIKYANLVLRGRKLSAKQNVFLRKTLDFMSYSVFLRQASRDYSSYAETFVNLTKKPRSLVKLAQLAIDKRTPT